MITYRSAPSSFTHAAYSGAVRVGYINKSSSSDTWLWSLNLLRPGGGLASGRTATLDKAKTALQQAFLVWLGDANLTTHHQGQGRTK